MKKNDKFDVAKELEKCKVEINKSDLLKHFKGKYVKTFLKRGKWKVYKNGDLSYANWYHITHDRLTHDDWIYHLFSKNWIDWNDFIPCYFQALKNINKEFVTIRIFYKNNQNAKQHENRKTNTRRMGQDNPSGSGNTR